MKMKFSALSALCLSAFAAMPISASADSGHSMISNQTQASTLNTALNNGDVSWEFTDRAIGNSSGEGNALSFNGSGNALTLIGSDASGNNNSFIKPSANVSFENFSSLTLQGRGDSSQTIFMRQPVTLSFGKSDKAIGSVTLQNLAFAAWWDGMGNDSQTANIDFYADTLKFTGTSVNVPLSNQITINKTSAENQRTAIDGSITVGAKNAVFSVLGGSLEVDGAVSASNDGQLFLGRVEETNDLTVLNDINLKSSLAVSTGGTALLVAENITVAKELRVNKLYEV